jgi:hypothetical protein
MAFDSRREGIFYLQITKKVEFHGIIDKKNDAGNMHM